VVAVLGVIEDVTRRTPTGFGETGHRVLLLGETHEELSGSVWADVVHDHLGGLPPKVDLGAERALSELLVAATGVLSSAHDVSDGGLAQTLAESCLRHGTGVRVDLAEVGDAFVALFAESAARVLVSVAPEDEERMFELAAEHGVPITSLGETRGDSLEVAGAFDVPLEELRTAWTLTLPAAMA
jgi:phosphoribosylformylglycinamidine synthase